MIPVLEKALAVVRAVAEDRAGGSANRLAQDLGIATATCHRILGTFEKADWVKPRVGGGFELSAGLLALLRPLMGMQQLIDAVKGPLQQLATRTELAAKLSVRQGTDAVTIYRAESPRPMALIGRTGARFPLVYGSSGAVLAADLDEAELADILDTVPPEAWKRQSKEDVLHRIAAARQQAVSVDRGSFHPQVYTISAPLRDADRRLVAAVTLIGLPDDFADDVVPSLQKELATAVRECRRAIGGERATRRARP